jgi:putative restriction endonuclease
VGDDPVSLSFTVAVDDKQFAFAATPIESPETEIRRRYVTRQVRQRLHQDAFRERVLAAYREHCAICRLRHHELLEAAHIIADRDSLGEPVRVDVLNEIDGPMLKHGLQGFHEAALLVPNRESLKPDRALLDARYALFRKAS